MVSFQKFLSLIPAIAIAVSAFSPSPISAEELAPGDIRQMSVAQQDALYVSAAAAEAAYATNAADPSAQDAAQNWLQAIHGPDLEAQEVQQLPAPAPGPTPGPIPQATPIKSGRGSAPRSINKIEMFQGGARTINVKILHYVTVVTGTAQFPAIVAAHKTALEQGSKFQGTGAQALNYNVVSTTTINGATPVIPSGPLSQTIDVASIYTSYGFCAQMNAGTLDQVWIWSDGWSAPRNGWEFVVNGSDWNVYTGLSNMPKCGKAGVTFSFVYANNASFPNPNGWYGALNWQAPHSYGHYMEQAHVASLQWDYSVCDFVDGSGRAPSSGYITATYYSGSYCPGRPLSWQYGFTSHQAAGNGNIAVCGDIHLPPNKAVLKANEYIYNTTTTVPSICNTWKWGLSNPTTNVGCSTWSANCADNNVAQYNYLIWWFQRLPSVTTNATGRTGALRPNHWDKVPSLILNTPDPIVRNDWDADAETDFTLYRPSTGLFWRQNTPTSAPYPNSTSCTYASVNPMTAQDSSGYFWVENLATGAIYRAAYGLCTLFGTYGANVVIGYGRIDGDSFSDRFAYNPATGVFTTTPTTCGCNQVFTGFDASATQVAADYDGDGLVDLATYKNSTGDWKIRLSTTGAFTTTVNWGAGGTYVPSVGDFDGDKKADITVFNTGDGFWHTYRMTVNNVQVSTQFGQAGDVPVPADYDKDYYVNRAVFRGSAGQWLYQSRALTTTTVTFGQAGDIPISHKLW